MNNPRQAFGRLLAVSCHVLLAFELILFFIVHVPTLYHTCGIYVTIVYSLIVLYLSICFAVSHVRAWFTEPGYPERIATATGALRRNFSREELKMMSPNMKQLINKRNKGFVALLNSGGQ